MEEQALVQLANEVLSKLPGSLRIKSWKELNSHVFVSLYEGLFAEALPDVIRPAKSREDEVHNIQAVIDTLSLDILNTSLSHLSGEAVVAGNLQAIKSLLEVFEWLFEYILEKIGSEASSDIGGEVTLDDPDLVTADVIDSILERELGRSHHSMTTKGRKGDKNNSRSKLEGDSTRDLIALGNNSRNTSKLSGADKTEDLIALGDSRQYKSRNGWTDGPLSPSSDKNQLKTSKKAEHGRTKAKVSSRNSSQPIPTGDLSHGVSSSRLPQDGFIRDRPVGSGSNGRLSSPISNGYNGDLSSGPLSTDMSDRGYIPDQSKDLSVSPTPGRETTADLIRESESLQKRLGLTSGDHLSASQIDSRVSGLESSLTSSSAYPKAVTTEPGTKSSEFDQIGLRPRSLITPTDTADGYRDTHANSLPLGSQYHSFTHHLYHHYDPHSSKRQPPPPPTALSSSTQVTPGRFSEGQGKEEGESAKAGHTNSGALQSSSYDNLRHMVQDTMNMSEQALQASPFRGKQAPAGSMGTERQASQISDEELTKRLRETLQKLHSSEESATDRSGTLDRSKQGSLGRSRSDHKRQENIRPKTQSILSPSKKRQDPVTTKVPRKVSFLTGKSDKGKSHTSSRVKDRSLSPDSSLSSPGFDSTRSYDSPVKGTRPQSSRALTSQGNVKPSRHKTARQKTTVKARTAEGRSTAKQMDRFAATAGQYFEKYYGRKRSEESVGENDIFYHSDGGVQYTDIGLDSSPEEGAPDDFKRELDLYKQELVRRSKQVRFDDILDDSAPGEMGGIRRKLAKEGQGTRFRAEYLKDVYDRELMDYEEGMREQMSKLQAQGKDIGKQYRKKVKSSPATTKYKPAKKYTAPKSVLLPKSKAHNRTPSGRRNRKRSATSSPAVGRDAASFYDNEILPWLLEEFPFLHISPDALHNMWRKSAKQMEVLSKTDQYIKAKQNRAQKQIEEAEYKQKLLAEIAKKELSHTERMRELDERKKQQQSVKATIREKRLQHARVRKYYDDFQVRMRSKMLKKRTREEMVFKKLFEEGLKTQRDRIRDLRQYSRDQREERAQKQKDELTSIENFYKDRFALLAEALNKEKGERQLTNKSQQRILNSMNREFRKKTEKEIETIQEQIFRDEDDEYFRQLDADRLRQELHLARYKARV